MKFNEEHRIKKQEQKAAFLKQMSRMPKKIDKKNKAKSLNKVTRLNFIDLNKKSNVFETFTPNKRFILCVRAIGLNFEFARFLEKNSNLMRKLFYDSKKTQHLEEIGLFFKEFVTKLKELNYDEKFIEMVKNSLASFGPRRYGPNLLLIKGLNPSDSLFSMGLKHDLPVDFNEEIGLEEEKTNKSSEKSVKIQIKEKSELISKYLGQLTALDINKALMAGFDMSVLAGPLCEEPMMGVCFIVEYLRPVENEEGKEEKSNEKSNEKGNEKSYEKSNEKSLKIENEINVEIDENIEKNEIGNLENTEKSEKSEKLEKSVKSQKNDKSEKNNLNNSENLDKCPEIKDLYGPLSGQIMSAMKEACLESFLGAMPRLVEGVYQCNLMTDANFYGKSYEVLNKRRATILEETLHENSNIFNINAHLPIQESFGFYSEILDKTSGRVNA